MAYEVHVRWDGDAMVWYVDETNVPGLTGEAETIEAMLTKLDVLVPEMLEENGIAHAESVPFELLAHRNAVANHRT